MPESENKQCPFPAAYQYLWAGEDELSYACAPHAQQLSNLCQHMGWGYQFEQVPLGEEHQCGQQLPENDPIFANQTEGGE